MKVTINTTAPKEREIDWSIPMIVANSHHHVLTDGIHENHVFGGMSVGLKIYANDWLKSAFTPCTTPITVTFENEL